MRPHPADDGPGASPTAARSLAQALHDTVRERFLRSRPQEAPPGPEDASWVLLESLSELLAEMQLRLDGLEERAVSRLLELLGEPPLWAEGARGAVAFECEPGLGGPVKAPRGTSLSAPRSSGEPRIAFETIEDAWTSTARLLRAAVVTGETHLELFLEGGGGPSALLQEEPVVLFGGLLEPGRWIYLGDPCMAVLRSCRALVLEFPGAAAILSEARFEHAAPGGWKLLRADLEETRSGQRRTLTVRLDGPLPDLAEVAVEGVTLPWIRISLPAGGRASVPAPRWRPLPGSEVEARGVARVLTHAAERWEDHSFSEERIILAASPESWDPAVYLGWDQACPASLYWAFEGRAIPESWGRLTNASPALLWEYSSGRGFRDLPVRDGTGGFARSGCVSWEMPSDWTARECLGERLHWVRIRWVGGAFAEPPRLRALLPHAAPVEQRTLHRGRLVELEADERGRAILDLALLEGEPEPFSLLEVALPSGGWVPLERASVRSGDVAEGSFGLERLGSGEYAVTLPTKLGRRLTARLPELREVLGARGNLPPWSLSHIESELPGVRAVRQPLWMEGGRDAEQPLEQRRRLRAEWSTGGRCVTSEDYRRRLQALDPEIARVEVRLDPADPLHVTAAVVPRVAPGSGRLAPARLHWLSATLEGQAPLGVRVDVMEAAYVPVRILGRSDPGAARPSPATARALEAAARAYFDPLEGGPDGRGFPVVDWSAPEGAARVVLDALGLGPGRAALPVAWAAGAPEWDPAGWRFSLLSAAGAPLLPWGASRVGGPPPPWSLPPLVLPVLESLELVVDADS